MTFQFPPSQPLKLFSMSLYSIRPASSSLLYAFSFRLSLVTALELILIFASPVLVSW